MTTTKPAAPATKAPAKPSTRTAAKGTAKTAQNAPTKAQAPKASSGPAKAPQAKATTATVRYYRLRKNGTKRAMPYLAPGTPERKAAEALAAAHAKGKTVSDLAAAKEMSVSTVRRAIVAVAFAKDVEAGTYAAQVDNGVVILPATTKDAQ